MDKWLEYVGRWHVLVIHFPIGLLATAALVEIVALFRKPRRPATTAVILTCLGAAGAIIAAAFGWILASNTKHPDAEQLLEYHRWAGVITASLAFIASILGVLALRKAPTLRWPFRLLLILTAAAVIITAHWGGELIYGEDYFWPTDQSTEQNHSHHHDSEDEPH